MKLKDAMRKPFETCYKALREFFSFGFITCLVGLVIAVSFVCGPLVLTLKYLMLSEYFAHGMVFSFAWIMYWVAVIGNLIRD